MSELKQQIEFAKEMGLESVEIAGIKYNLRSNPVILPNFVAEAAAEDLVRPLSSFEELTEEEITYWATPYFDEIQARKEAAKNQKQIDDQLRHAL